MRVASFSILLELIMPAKIHDVRAFDIEFDKALETLGASEKITKDVLKVYANMAIDACHQFNQPAYLNKLRTVLTPVNMRAFTEFAIHFSGYHFDKDAMLFDKKSKKRYAPALEGWNTFREDPLNNIWTWQRDNLKVERQPFNVESLRTSLGKTWKTAHKANISNVDILKALLSVQDADEAAVFTVQDVAEALQSMGIEGALSVEENSILAPKDDNVGNVQKAEPAPF